MMVVQNSELAGFVLAGLLIALLVGMAVWGRLKWSNCRNQKANPIAEAEIYLAYGRKKKAIEVLEKAIAENPGDAGIRKKLEELRLK